MFTATLRTRLAALRLFRPRAVARLVKTVEESRRELRDLVRAVKQLQEHVTAVKAGHEQSLERLQTQQTESFESAARHRAALADDVRALTQTLREVSLRERQLRAIARTDAELDASERELDTILRPSAVSSHVRSAIASTTLHEDPFPYAVVDNLLPDNCYDALIRRLPPADLFADRPVNKQQLKVPLDLAPSYSRRVWAFMAAVVAADMIAPAIVEKFDTQATAWLRLNFPALGTDPLRAISLTWLRRPHPAPTCRLLHPPAPRPEVGVPHLSSVPRAARRQRALRHVPVPGRQGRGGPRRETALDRRAAVSPGGARRLPAESRTDLPQLHRRPQLTHPAACATGRSRAICVSVPHRGGTPHYSNAACSAARGTPIPLGRQDRARLLRFMRSRARGFTADVL